MNKDDVLKTIQAAFQDIPYPGDDHIAYRKSIPEAEESRVAEFFRGKRWEEITAKTLQEDYRGDGSCLAFMSDEAFIYYLPAYMVIAIQEYEEADVIADSAVFALSPPKGDIAHLRPWWQERVAGFTKRQREAILLFLQFMHEHHKEDYDYPDSPLAAALEYWQR